ncbi:MAG: choice-of-anchor A family protein [Ferrimicrobium sp.]|uniref:choice-of-anchor A family protein n=1 Tax=Ferrimicrobium sp. TaxID=2926050 RepID=UPI002615753A|nr:choice-of-anchor A family protein [Ferrimicrobium sp.]
MIRSLLAVPLIAMAGLATSQAPGAARPTSSAQLTAASAPSFGTRQPFAWGTFVASTASIDGTVTGTVAFSHTTQRATSRPLEAKMVCTSDSCGATPLAFGLVEQILRLDANRWAQLTPNTTIHSVPNGIRIAGTNGTLDIVDLSTLPAKPFTVFIDAPRTATVLLNLSQRAAQTIDELHTTVLAGPSIAKVLWNFAQASVVRLPKTSFLGSVLAPVATTIGPTVMRGDILTQNLTMGTPTPMTIHDSQAGFDGLLPQYPVTDLQKVPSARYDSHSVAQGPLRITAP